MMFCGMGNKFSEPIERGSSAIFLNGGVVHPKKRLNFESVCQRRKTQLSRERQISSGAAWLNEERASVRVRIQLNAPGESAMVLQCDRVFLCRGASFVVPGWPL